MNRWIQGFLGSAPSSRIWAALNPLPEGWDDAREKSSRVGLMVGWVIGLVLVGSVVDSARLPPSIVQMLHESRIEFRAIDAVIRDVGTP